jgi:8-oxo-dGTP pyrophosphatase MutT (NUDIX family)
MSRHTLPVTVHMFLIRDNHILLLRRFQTGYEDGNYSVPAGHLDGGEPVRLAAVREAQEEIGVTLAPQDLSFVGVIHRGGDSERVDFFVKVGQWSGEPYNAEPDKCDELRWVGIDDLPDNTIPYVRQAIENLAHGVTIQEYGWDR